MRTITLLVAILLVVGIGWDGYRTVNLLSKLSPQLKADFVISQCISLLRQTALLAFFVCLFIKQKKVTPEEK